VGGSASGGGSACRGGSAGTSSDGGGTRDSGVARDSSGAGGSGCRGGSGGTSSDGGGTGGGGAGGTGGMSNDLPALCGRYCDCMANHNESDCKSRTPANCMNTCMQQGHNWDLTCRIDKCVKAKTDYKDQIRGDCLAAVGDQACFNIE
jgi:hypothetical protein